MWLFLKYFRFSSLSPCYLQKRGNNFHVPLACVRGYFVYSCISKVVRIFVCILCIKRMLPGNFQLSVMSKHSGFTLNLLTWAQHCRGSTKMGHISFAWSQESTCSHQHPLSTRCICSMFGTNVWVWTVFLKKTGSGVFSGSVVSVLPCLCLFSESQLDS